MKKISFLNLMLVASVLGVLLVMSCSSSDKNNNDNNPIPQTPLAKYEYNGDSTICTVTDTGLGTGTMTWRAKTAYLLKGFVFVNDGSTLTIEPGTVIKGKPGQAESASSFIVARGGKVIAKGTKEKPIIFTYEADDVNNTAQPEDFQRGLWGGVIILGKSKLNTASVEQIIEGIPITEKRGVFGGTDDADNSGVLSYVSIRHSGTNIGAGNEINGLSLGAVGSGTQIDHIDIVYCADDGVECFGSTCNIKYIVTSFCNDDGIDTDMGWRGNIQFGLVIQENKPGGGDRGGEWDGGTEPEDGKPYAIPTLYNITFIGGGKDSTSRQGAIFRDNAGGHLNNCLFTEFGKGVAIEDMLPNLGEDSYARYTAGDLTIKGTQFWNIGANADSLMIYVTRQSADDNSKYNTVGLLELFNAGGNTTADPGLSISYDPNHGLNPVPNSSVSQNVATNPGGWFDAAPYKGAFAPGGDNWLKGWTWLDKHGYLQ